MPDIGIEVAFSCRPWTLEDKVTFCFGCAQRLFIWTLIHVSSFQLGCSFTNTPNPGDEEGHTPDPLIGENGELLPSTGEVEMHNTTYR